MPKIHFFNRPLRILLATNALILLAAAMLGPIYAIYVERIGGDLLDASFAGAAFALVAGITTLVAGRTVDSFKHDGLILAIGYLVTGLGFLLFLVIDSVAELLMVQMLIGFAEAFYGPAFDALYSRHISQEKAGWQWGAWEAVRYFALAIGAAFGGYIVVRFGFDMLFLAMALFCFASALYIYRLPNRILD